MWHLLWLTQSPIPDVSYMHTCIHITTNPNHVHSCIMHVCVCGGGGGGGTGHAVYWQKMVAFPYFNLKEK